jgi:hypothetical protein
MNTEIIKKLVKKFYPYAKKKLGFDKPVKIIYITKDAKNADDPFGKTGYYNPDKKTITLFLLNRHPKDVLRTLAHELTHHAQHCKNNFDDIMYTEDGYAQKNPELRKRELEAYTNSILVRDWTDTLPEDEKEEIMKDMSSDNDEQKEIKQVRKKLKDEQEVNDMFEERRMRLNKKLLDKFITKKKEGSKE